MDCKLTCSALHQLDLAIGEDAKVGYLIRWIVFEVEEGDSRGPDLFKLLVSLWPSELLEAAWSGLRRIGQARVIPSKPHINGASEYSRVIIEGVYAVEVEACPHQHRKTLPKRQTGQIFCLRPALRLSSDLLTASRCGGGRRRRLRGSDLSKEEQDDNGSHTVSSLLDAA